MFRFNVAPYYARMKNVFLALAVIVISGCTSISGEKPVKATNLFDGKSFAGWSGDTNKTWRIENGAIVGGSLTNPIPRNEFLCSTASYGDFVLHLKFKLIGKGVNSGVQVRTKKIPNNHEVSGYQADLGDPGWWGSLYDESRRNKVLAQSKAEEVNKVLKRDDWNDYRIRCEGKRIQIWLNDLQTIDYIEPDDTIAQSGVIALQIHAGPPSEAWFKDIVLEKLGQ